MFAYQRFGNATSMSTKSDASLKRDQFNFEIQK